MEVREHLFNNKIRSLLKVFAEQEYINQSTVENKKNQEIINTCTELWKLDYKCEVIDNSAGIICTSYPSKIVLPLYELGPGGEVLPNSCPITLSSQALRLDSTNEDFKTSNIFTIDEAPSFASVVSGTSSSPNDSSEIEPPQPPSLCAILAEVRSHLKDARRARCRYRVPFPAILCKGKYISRAGTLSSYLDVCRKNLVLYATESKEPGTDPSELNEAVNDMPEDLSSAFYDVETARNADIKLLKILGISQIIDLMVEFKKVKFFMNVTSSEKADSRDRYFEFRIASMPYPGCEFFVNFTKNNLRSNNLYIDWDSPTNDAQLSLPDGFDGPIPSLITKEWETYKSWDLRKITEYYLRYILDYITDEQSKEKGFLIHCISGWDRTPLFISLLRLSLWADGLVHSSLDATQMLYFTLAYDWYLFGHQLPQRLGTKENIMYFCFEFLEIIFMDNYTSNKINRSRHVSTGSEAAEIIDKGAVGGFDTPSSFGSTTSLDSISNHSQSGMQPHPNIKISGSSHAFEENNSNWPYKENGFSFDGISENEVLNMTHLMNGLSVHSGNTYNSFNGNDSSKRVSPSRSPLKEKNCDTPSKRCRKFSGEDLGTSTSSSASPLASSSSGSENRNGLKSTGSFKKNNLNGFLKDFASRRSRKISTTEPPARFHVATDSVDIGASESSVANDSDSEGKSMNSVSNPVAVPGTRARHDSTGSSIGGSWHLLSPTEVMEGHRTSKTSLTANMEESTNTIQEEVTPSSSVESSQSIIVFNRRRRLTEVKEKFYKLYGEVRNLTLDLGDQAGLVDLLSNMVQRVVT